MKEMNFEKLASVANQFNIEGVVKCIEPVGNGHINDTYLVRTDRDNYLLQRINDHVFGSPERLMENVTAVTEFIGGRLRVIPAKNGRAFVRTANGFFRMLTYIGNSYSCEHANDPETFREIGRAYGAFINDLAEFPADRLNETIEGFHDTRRRFEQFRKACESDPLGRKSTALPEIGFAFAHEKDVDYLNDCVKRGEIPVRVTHNDTKINNVMLDRDTGKAVAVIDLDTVMPGLAVNDFGDAIRSGAATGCEDDPDAESIRLDIELYRSYAKGFMEGFPGLTKREKELLPFGAGIMTLECWLRFLTDYLEGDHYFKTDYPGQNLARCRTQFRLVREIENHWDELQIEE